MTKRLRKTAVLLIALSLIFGVSLNVYATSLENKLNDAEAEAQSIKSDKAAAESKLDSLNSKLSELNDSIADTQNKIQVKLEEIDQAEADLIQAMLEEQSQKKAMTLRIKYMYENGNAQFVEILCESKNIGEFLNNAEYITTISEYDRTMLVEFQAVVKDVEEQEAALQAEYDELETMQNDLITKQDSVTELMESKDAEIEQISSDLGDTKDKLSELQAAAAAAERKQQEKNSGYSNNAGASVITGNGTFTHPCPGYTYISSEFGYREQPIAGASTNHKGMDFAAPAGTPIYAAASGTVTSASYSGNAGNMIVINHGNGLQTYYMHCNSMYVRAGQTVSKGQNIGAVGSTGNSSGPHLHFQVMQNGTPVNPRNYL